MKILHRLRRFHIENVRCIKSLDIELTNGINVIHGSTSSGKTTLMAILSWFGDLDYIPIANGGTVSGNKELLRLIGTVTETNPLHMQHFIGNVMQHHVYCDGSKLENSVPYMTSLPEGEDLSMYSSPYYSLVSSNFIFHGYPERCRQTFGIIPELLTIVANTLPGTPSIKPSINADNGRITSCSIITANANIPDAELSLAEQARLMFYLFVYQGYCATDSMLIWDDPTQLFEVDVCMAMLKIMVMYSMQVVIATKDDALLAALKQDNELDGHMSFYDLDKLVIKR